MYELDTSDIISCTFLIPPQEDVQNSLVRIVKMIDGHEKKLAKELGHIQFIYYVIDYQCKGIMSYIKIINYITN